MSVAITQPLLVECGGERHEVRFCLSQKLVAARMSMSENKVMPPKGRIDDPDDMHRLWHCLDIGDFLQQAWGRLAWPLAWRNGSR